MSTIRIVWGTAGARTRKSAYDAALAAAGVHDYNLATVSSVIPDGTTVEAVDTAPDLGPVGDELTVVQARATSETDRVSAGIAWAQTEDGRGVLYEAAGEMDPDTVRDRVERGLADGTELRSRRFVRDDAVVVSADPGDGYTAAVVLAVYGESRPIRSFRRVFDE